MSNELLRGEIQQPNFDLKKMQERLQGWQGRFAEGARYLFEKTTADDQRLYLDVDKPNSRISLTEIVDFDGNCFSIELDGIKYVQFGKSLTGDISFMNNELVYKISLNGVAHTLSTIYSQKPVIHRTYNMYLKTSIDEFGFKHREHV